MAPEPGPAHHLNHLTSASDREDDLPAPLTPRPLRRKPPAPLAPPCPSHFGPRALQWVQHPWQSFRILAAVTTFYIGWELVLGSSGWANPARPFLFVSYPMPHKAGDPMGFVRCRKGPLDLLFLPFYIVALWV